MDKTAPSIDGHVDLKETADHLADKYDRLYNSVPTDAEAMEQIADPVRTTFNIMMIKTILLQQRIYMMPSST